MLVLSRKLGEEIYIGEGENAVKLTVVAIEGSKIRLGITAPRSVPVFRAELLDLGNGSDGQMQLKTA